MVSIIQFNRYSHHMQISICIKFALHYSAKEIKPGGKYIGRKVRVVKKSNEIPAKPVMPSYMTQPHNRLTSNHDRPTPTTNNTRLNGNIVPTSQKPTDNSGSRYNGSSFPAKPHPQYNIKQSNSPSSSLVANGSKTSSTTPNTAATAQPQGTRPDLLKKQLR